MYAQTNDHWPQWDVVSVIRGPPINAKTLPWSMVSSKWYSRVRFLQAAGLKTKAIHVKPTLSISIIPQEVSIIIA
jgi:hypothetical protein